MTDILCKWLNEELRLSQVVEPRTFAQAFSSGYLLGEILHKYQMQNDFHMFMKKERSISMLNNFTRLEPSLHLLGIPFSATTAQEVMQEKQGVAAHIVYQLHNSLERKKKADMSVTVMEMMQPAAVASLHTKEREIYRDRLHKVVKREALVNFQRMSQYYENKAQQMSRFEVATAVQQKKTVSKQPEKPKKPSDKVQKPMPSIEASIVQVPKPRPHLSDLNLRKQQRQQRQEKLAQYVENEIAQFETKRWKLPSSSLSNVDGQSTEVKGVRSKPVLMSNSVYIQQIQQRLEEDALACEQRDKHVDRFLIEQAKAREAETNAKHEEYLIRRLTRSTKQEQRLVAQLQQIRKQKEVFINNRLFREQQIQQRREKDLEEAVKRESVLAEQDRMARAEEIKRKLDYCNRPAPDPDQIMCQDIVEQIVDLSTKVGEYRLSGNPVPVKQMKEWKEVLFSGLPLYETTDMGNNERPVDMDTVELQKQDIRNNLDYDEYINMEGEWTLSEEGKAKLPPANNNILGSVVARLRKLVHPPCKNTVEPPFPFFSLKACVLGKLCSGKTSCLAKIAQARGIHILSATALVNEALNAYNHGETATEQLSDQENATTTDINEDLPQDKAITKLSKRALYGGDADREMMEGKVLPLELLIKIITEAIHQLPANSGWILDGFPVDLTQALLLEKALVGSVDEEQPVVTNTRLNLAVDPDPPEVPPSLPPALDLVLLLDVSDESAVSRAVNLAYAAAADSTPDYLYMSQIQHRVTAFKETWRKLEQWFGAKQNILIRVDANVDEEELFNSVDSVLQQVKRASPEVCATPVQDEASSDKSRLSSPNQEMTPNLNPTESSSSISSEKGGKRRKQTSNSRASSRRSSTSSESSVKYVEKPLPPGTPEALHQHWENLCETYVNNIKAVMQELRLESTRINQHSLNIKEEFLHYLGRPVLRQEFVSQWQKDFNNVADDMKDNEDTKAELHIRLDELCERLWNISERRKEENEQEKAAVMEDVWLSDHTALMLNYHSILIQVELDRFRDTFFILEKYYLSNKPVPEPHLKLNTISLLSVPSQQDLETQPQEPTEHEQKLVEDYEEAVTAIKSLMGARVQQRETEVKQPQEKVEEPPSAKKGKKKISSSTKKKGAPTPPPAAPSSEQTDFVEVKPKAPKAMTAALTHEVEAANARIGLVKAHGLNLVNFIQSNAEQIFNGMEEWLKEHFDNEMKSIEQLSEVVRHHIESGAKLQKQLVLDHSHFCLNGDFQMVSLPPVPPRPALIEKPSQNIFSIFQLEPLCPQFRREAPNGLMQCLEFFTLFKEILSSNANINGWPEPLVNVFEAQAIEIVALLKDQYECMNWCRFMLSCAQPWPSPSVPQLLDALQHFKAADVENKGYINEGQYLQTQLWFSKEIPEDTSEPLPCTRSSNLHKFFFQVFADHSSVPPRLDYTSMLLYLAADPDPKQGFIRALSLAVGQHLSPISTQLVKSMPSLEEVPDFSSPDLHAVDYNHPESPSSALSGNQMVSIPALLTVLDHSCSSPKSEHTELLVGVYKDLGYEPEATIPFSTLCTHPFIQNLMESSTQHQLVIVEGLDAEILKDKGSGYFLDALFSGDDVK